MTEELELLIARARREWEAKSPADREAMIAAQKVNYAVSEAAWGSDADEAAYRAAYEAGDEAEMARLEAESQARMDASRKRMEGRE
ncbi:MAG: hypothetical protein MUE98_00040 [Rhodobacteraceae bacterium]|jgi:hypothetical protein|nr:hypothetical protein [Paracoccaceae bacterium]